jgi:TrmH family RNA methyltransferase
MVITSRQNPLIKKFRKPEKDLFVAEGEKLISEAINAGFVPLHILFTEKKHSTLNRLKETMNFKPSLTGLNINCDVITSELSEYISDTKSPQGVFALFGKVTQMLAGFAFADAPFMILDGVQDPGNVGAIIRSCEAFGFFGIVLSEDCADIFSPKVIRAAAGSVFRLKHNRTKLTELIPRLKKAGITIYGTALDKNAVSVKEVVFSEKCAIIIGNEGRGISSEVLPLCDSKIYIPIKGAESLNASVAAGIFWYEAMRKQTAKTIREQVSAEVK